MKNFILGIIVVLSICATTLPQLTTIKPAQPRAWIMTVGSPEAILKDFAKYSKQGYIVHIMETERGWGQTYLITYKYY